MYNVSDAYKKAIEQPSRQFELGGEIRLKSGDVIPITDDIVRDDDDVVVETRAMSADDETDIGACCSAVLTMTITDDNKEHLYADAEIELICSLIFDNGEKEPIPMGTFFVGANTAKRTGKKFSLTAYDSMLKLQYLLTENMRADLKGMTGYQAARYLYEGEMAQDEKTVTAFPNGDIALDFSASSVETARDAIMWIGQLMGCFSRIDRLGRLEFVQLQPHNWSTDGVSLFIHPERVISPNQRFKTEFSDKRTQIFTLVMRDKDNNPIFYRGNPISTTRSTLISYETEQNPLVLEQTSRSVYDVLKNIVSNSLHRMAMQTFCAEIANDPALEAGDYVTIQSGGDNDLGDFYSMITHNIWRYRGRHKIISGASMQVVAFDQPVTAAYSARRAVEEKTYVQPIFQSDKAARNPSGSTVTDTLIHTDGGYTCTLKLDYNRLKHESTRLATEAWDFYHDYAGEGFHFTDKYCYVKFNAWNGITIIPEDMSKEEFHNYAAEITISSSGISIIPTGKNRKPINITHTGLIRLNNHQLEFKDDGLYYDNKKLAFE